MYLEKKEIPLPEGFHELLMKKLGDNNETRVNITNLIKKSMWFSDIRTSLNIEVKDERAMEAFNDDNYLSNLILNILFTKKPFIIVEDLNTKELDICHIDILIGSLKMRNSHIKTNNALRKLRWFFEQTKEFKSIIDKLQRGESEYEQMFYDITNIRLIDDDFVNSTLNAVLKDGKPYYMEVGTKTDNTDFVYWKDVLWSERKIEDNVSGDKTKSLKITKKHKYWNIK